MESGEGIFGCSASAWDGEKHVMQANRTISLENKSFYISFWAKIKRRGTGTDSKYLVGTSDESSSNQSHRQLHIGYRSNDTFTLAFYADDANWTVPVGKKFTDIEGKWTHFFVVYNASNNKSFLCINGDKVGADHTQ